MRSNRKFNELRNIKVEINFMKNAFSSCLIEFGLTKVICSVTLEEKIPRKYNTVKPTPIVTITIELRIRKLCKFFILILKKTFLILLNFFKKRI